MTFLTHTLSPVVKHQNSGMVMILMINLEGKKVIFRASLNTCSFNINLEIKDEIKLQLLLLAQWNSFTILSFRC